MPKDDKIFIDENSNLAGFDIKKRDQVLNEDGTKSDETIATIYSMDYLDEILDAIRSRDNSEG